ncbi:Ribokinase-like protein [Gonapodya prolifera JEL478]|uniref:Ribokinase n=1 Tax=Gonapodya prolifera (strain JEL478) TaxID=1344416 RepID=A0A138ZYR2_GONPJ|nr:Ribokinase-like protein [Gonapodya prolifera JEL478]|eukprot:KXS09630.1 Ribokinase-like protein [Gonapodya prolifera JEL478]
MPTILCLGSINIDDVFTVPHIVTPGETLASTHYKVSPGGKGANQSVALAKAGAAPLHAGIIGPDGRWVRDLMRSHGVDIRLIELNPDLSTGRAIIQHRETSGENAIVLFAGANHAVTRAWADGVLDGVDATQEQDRWIVMQNEISAGGNVMASAVAKGFVVVFNPAPFHASVLDTFPIAQVHVLVFNEIEFAGFIDAIEGGSPRRPADVVDTLMAGDTEESRRLFQSALRRGSSCALLVVTVGARGVVACVVRRAPETGDVLSLDVLFRPTLPDVHVADTTAAGDTFVGYLVAALAKSKEVRTYSKQGASVGLDVFKAAVEEALARATVAAGMACEMEGAMGSVPEKKRVDSRGHSLGWW